MAKQRWVLGLTALGFFMVMMDSMIVTTASTAIRTDFKISVSSLQWALNAYNIAIAAVLLVGVALGERFGRRRVYELGILIFCLGSIGCALSPNIAILIGARVVAGIGASVMTPMSMAILTQALPANRRGQALGIWSGIGGLALIIGPSLGGWIVTQLTWQWIFWINLPIGLAVVGLSQRHLTESCGQAEPINWLDAWLLIFVSTGLIWALSATTMTAISQPLFLGLVVVIGGLSLVGGGWFIHRQNQTNTPLLPMQLFKTVAFIHGNVATFLLYAAMYGIVFFLPQYLQVSRHATALTAGLELLPWTGTLVLVAPFAGQAVDRWGTRIVALWGLLLQGIGYLLLVGLLVIQTTYVWLIFPLALAGVGLSMGGPALQKAVLGAATPTLLGKAAGVYNVFRLFGGAVGTTLAVIGFSSVGSYQTANRFTAGVLVAFLGAAILSLLGCWSAWQLKRV